MVFYFTATGNSLYVAKQLDEERLSIPQEMNRENRHYKAERIGIVCPLFEFEIPPLVKDFIRDSEFEAGYFYLVVTYGMHHGGVAGRTHAWLESIGKPADYVNTIIMHDNALIVFDMDQQRSIEAEKQVDAHIDAIRSDIAAKRVMVQQAPADETRAYMSTRGMFRDSFGRLYVRQYLDESVREEIRQICEEVVDTYREMLDTTDWLSAETREAAKNKLDAIAIHAVYPDKWEDYSNYSVNEDGDILTARLDRAAADKQRDIGRMNEPVDKELWGDIDIIETNAYYEPKDNSINIIPGFFCDVTYRSDMSIEEKYGALGGVIGHEISHAFDSGGAQYDAAGNFNNWWTPEDKAAFDERTGKVIAYFDKIVPFDDGTPNSGKLVNTEATADTGGIKCMLLMAEKIDGFDYDKFFRAYARMWQRMDTLQMCEWLATSDSHPLSYQRINVTLQQFDEFLDTYGIKEGDGMYLAPEDRILVW